jgi:tetratricopeptide (TPR) repeat protein
MDARSAGAWFGLGATWFTMMRRSLEELHTAPDSPWTRALLAQTFEDKGRWDDAIALRRQLAGESVGPPCPRAALGSALLGAGQTEQAGEQFRLELAAHPGCWAAPMAPYAERPRKRVACSPTVASCAFEAGDYRAVLASANAVLRHRPADQEALYWRVQAASRLSLDALTRAGLADPGSARVHMMLGEIYREQENFTESREEFVKALAIAPTEPRAHLGMARTCEALGDWDTAIRELQTYLPTAPHDPDAAFMMGRLLVGQARFDAALPFAIAALQVDQPDRPGVHALVAKIYEHQERTEDALRELKLALPADDDGSYHYRMSRLLRTLGRNQEAQAALAESKVLHERKSHLAEAAMEKRVGAVLGQ